MPRPSRKQDHGSLTLLLSRGAILYQLLTGNAPLLGDTPLATLRKVVEEDPVPPSKLNPAVPPDLETICLTCLEKKPERRYPTARALAEELGRFLNHEPILARPASELRKALSWTVKRPWLVVGALALIGAVVVTGLAGFVYGFWEYAQLVDWRSAHPGELSPYRTAKDFVNAHGTYFVWGKLTLALLVGPYFSFYFKRKGNKPVSSRLFAFYTVCAFGMLALGIVDILLIVKQVVWTSWITARSLGPWYFIGPLYVFVALGFLLNLFLQRQSQWFGRELLSPTIFRAGPPPSWMPESDSFAGRHMPEFLVIREAFRRGQLLKRCLPVCGVILGCNVLALAANRDREWAAVMAVMSGMSAHALCMLTIGLVPASLRRHIIDNYALFLPGKREKNFIIYGVLNLFNLTFIGATLLPIEF